MEVNIGIICTCLPTVRLILQRMFPKILSSGDEQNNDARLSRVGGTASRGETQRPTFLVELSTTTLATDARSSYKHFDN